MNPIDLAKEDEGIGDGVNEMQINTLIPPGTTFTDMNLCFSTATHILITNYNLKV